MAVGSNSAALPWRHVITRAGALVIAVGLMMAILVVAPAFARFVSAANAPYVVNSTADTALATDPTLCDTSSVCTLRAAIERANSAAGNDRIDFELAGDGPHTITIASRLPLLTDQAGVTIDGYSQPGASVNTLDHGSNADIRVELRGPGAASNVEGFYIRSSNNVIRGLAIYDFDKHIRIYGDDPTTSADDIAGSVTNNRIIGNFIGTDAAGTFRATERVTSSDGVHLQHGTTANLIGMPGNQHRNVISGVADRGVGLYNPGTDYNLIQNNVVGLAPGADGVTPLGNWNHGIDINLGASNNTVGGSNVGEGNVVSANGQSGVEVSHNPGGGLTESNRVIGNLIGTSADGTRALAETANVGYGIYFEGAELCLTTCGADITRNVASGNVVVGSRSNIVLSKGATENVVSGNWIGVLADGTKPESAAVVTQQGVSIEAGAFGNRIENNTIGHSERGIHAMPPDSQCPLPAEPNGPECRAAEFAVFHNSFSQNSISNVRLMAIELRTKVGAGYVDGPGAGSDVNDGIAAPVIVASGVDQVTTDRLVVTTCAGCTVEVFAEVDPVGTCCWLDRGRGDRYLFSAVADGTGRAEVVLRTVATDPLVLQAHTDIAATTTDTSGNTSEFSVRATVALGALPLPDTSTTTTTIPTPPPGLTAIEGADAGEPADRCRLTPGC